MALTGSHSQTKPGAGETLTRKYAKTAKKQGLATGWGIRK